MALTTNFQVAGISERRQGLYRAALTEAFSSRPGKWHVQFIGSRSDEVWEVRLSGPTTETSGYVDATHDPAALAQTVATMVD